MLSLTLIIIIQQNPTLRSNVAVILSLIYGGTSLAVSRVSKPLANLQRCDNRYLSVVKWRLLLQVGNKIKPAFLASVILERPLSLSLSLSLSLYVNACLRNHNLFIWNIFNVSAE
ncbi:MAG: hypothetical protein FD170_1134 [Bacteroidetes bacterium]|nr:MAG: hypothetical protein FD170_1134 [Bacteroidota bacterium]